MTYPQPQGPWHDHPPVPGKYQTIPPTWWGRRSPLQRVGIIIGLPVLLCCGGLLGIGATADPEPESAKRPAAQASAAELDAVTGTVSPAAPPATPSRPSPTQPQTASPTAKSPKPVYYANCDAVRDAGKAPLRKGQPGYRLALDRDKDGVACEDKETVPAPPKPPKPPSTDPRFSTCAAAKAAGYGPYVRGVDPEYWWYIDRDKDGRVCE